MREFTYASSIPNPVYRIHVFNFLGSLFIALGVILVLPLIVVLISGEIHEGFQTLFAFLLPSIFSFILGIVCRSIFRGGDPNNPQAMLICSLGWIGFSAIGALPFVIAIKASYLNGLFETMSGFTTTGITMFTNLDQMPKLKTRDREK